MHIDSKANLRSKGKLLWQMDRLPQKCVTSFHATNRWLNIEFTDKWPFLGIYFSGPPPHFNLASEVHIPDQNNFWIIVFMVVSNIWKDAVWKWCSWKKTKGILLTVYWWMPLGPLMCVLLGHLRWCLRRRLSQERASEAAGEASLSI